MKFSDEQIGQLKGAIKQIISPILEQELTPIRKDIRKIRKDMRFFVDVLDNADIELR